MLDRGIAPNFETEGPSWLGAVATLLKDYKRERLLPTCDIPCLLVMLNIPRGLHATGWHAHVCKGRWIYYRVVETKGVQENLTPKATNYLVHRTPNLCH